MSWGAGLYGLNVLLGGAYVLSWTVDSGFIEWLSVLHLLLASGIFLIFSSAILMARIDAIDSEEE
jgi:heme A synthase|tara:strand:- start:1308 stop:1502 length:195 start_codon:yes stop_codon:yes gene_type:complete